MDVADLDYELPEELIAQRPLEARDAARLLVVDGERTAHASVGALPSLLSPSLFVVNDTRVLSARLRGRKAASGGEVEVLLVERLSPPGTTERWSALARASKPLRPGAALALGAIRATVEDKRDGHVVLALSADEPIDAILEREGEVPLPPYIRRDVEPADRAAYQTVFAAHPGAVAAPTAGLHFTPALLDALAAAGHELAAITLHVGPGTFRPVKAARLEDHPMHVERYAIAPATVEAIARAKREGRAVVAVGTTVVRTLEAAAKEGAIRAGEGATDLFIRPPFEFRVIDALLTNFHLPRSTLLALVMAFAGVAPTRAAYAEAVRARYRFFSYGDAMLVRSRA
ncbi:MAG: tRNA preQ1(34) S-adenosylmethionine ribosyltransferase-isomerase QueA [Sandaracinaceae bacterium]|nr:tRNA preQ1(34) S-adenosylmethionine ribosyltransferase-isomerase QueA [Sandaracinaceae bacterium]